jgi:hypothetical protein
VFGGQYIVAGDGGMTVAQAASRTPYIVNINETGNKYSIEITTYSTDEAGIGSVFVPHIDSEKRYYLNSGLINTFELDSEELEAFLKLEDVPVFTGNELRWSSTIELTK